MRGEQETEFLKLLKDLLANSSEAEPSAVNRLVVGSIPTSPAKFADDVVKCGYSEYPLRQLQILRILGGL